MSNHHCEAYTASPNALLLSSEKYTSLEFPLLNNREQHRLFTGTWENPRFPRRIPQGVGYYSGRLLCARRRQ